MPPKGHVVERPFNVLKPEEVERVHEAMLQVLEQTGVVFDDERALRVLSDAGCTVEKQKKRVTFPPSLVEDALRKCPGKVVLKARNPEYDVELGGNRVCFCPWIGMDTVDIETWERRTPVEQDFLDASRVLDYLDEVHVYGFGPYAHIDEKVASGVWAYLWLMAFNLRHCQKALFAAAQMGSDAWMVRMFNLVGVRPAVLLSGAPPLTWPGHQLQLLFSAAEADFPLNPFSGVAAGASSPATLAGTVVQNYAEVAAIIVLAQVFRPGLEVLVGNYSQVMGMRESCVIQGGPERALLDAAWSQVWRRNGIPCTGIVGSDAKAIDYQCAVEKTLSAMVMAMAGSNKIYFHGGVYDELTNHPVAAILDNDAAKMVGRILDGIRVDETTLAADLIREVGPAPGSFLGTRHTRENWKKEQLLPDVFDRWPYPEWVNRGKQDSIARARAKFAEIVSRHEVPPLPADQEKELAEMLVQSKKELESKGLV
ncbi:MAG: trimethylamine methyltransferase family protein [bacterium]